MHHDIYEKKIKICTVYSFKPKRKLIYSRNKYSNRIVFSVINVSDYKNPTNKTQNKKVFRKKLYNLSRQNNKLR